MTIDHSSVILGLRTEECIITGKKATQFTGHVLAKYFIGDSKVDGEPNFIDISIIAGFASDVEIPKSNGKGCFGTYKPEYGIQQD